MQIIEVHVVRIPAVMLSGAQQASKAGASDDIY